MKYNVGDKVRIKSLDWYNQMLSIPSKIVGKDDFVAIECGAHIFTKGMCKFCGRVMTIQDIGIDFYLMDEDVLGYEFTDEMIEGLVYRSGEGTWSFAEGQESHTESSSELYKEHVENIDKETNKIIANAVAGEMLAVKTMLDCILAKGLLIPNGYEIKDEKGNVINAQKIVLEKVNTLKLQSDNMETETHRGYYTTEEETTNESKKVAWFTFWDNDFADKVELDLSNRELIQEDGKWFVVKKKKEYPKTYEECCKVLDIDAYDLVLSIDYRSNKMKHNDWKRLGKLNVLNQILICRDAYWKLYGEEKGLGKPWEPDWNDECYVIFTSENGLIKRDTQFGINVILAFPTAEMRDAFYDNFKEEIEKCKELL